MLPQWLKLLLILPARGVGVALIIEVCAIKITVFIAVSAHQTLRLAQDLVTAGIKQG